MSRCIHSDICRGGLNLPTYVVLYIGRRLNLYQFHPTIVLSLCKRSLIRLKDSKNFHMSYVKKSMWWQFELSLRKVRMINYLYCLQKGTILNDLHREHYKLRNADLLLKSDVCVLSKRFVISFLFREKSIYSRSKKRRRKWIKLIEHRHDRNILLLRSTTTYILISLFSYVNFNHYFRDRNYLIIVKTSILSFV